MEQSIQQLRAWSDKFLTLILESLDHIPFGMRYIAKVMFESLQQKFPEAAEKDILKVRINRSAAPLKRFRPVDIMI